MTMAAILGVIALLGAIVAWATWHRGADERQSVNDHQHTLQTLGHLAGRGELAIRPSSRSLGSASKGAPPPRPSPRTKSVPGAERNNPPRRSGNGAPHRSGNGAPRTANKAASSFWRTSAASSAPSTSTSVTERSHATRESTAKASAKVDTGRRETVVFIDDTPGAPGERAGATSSSAPGGMGSAIASTRHYARSYGRNRVRRTRIAATAVIVVGVGVGCALAFAPSHGASNSASRRSHPVARSRRGQRALTAPPADVTASAPTAYSATYAVMSSPYTVVLSASQMCWVMATQAATGKVVWTGTIAAGASHSLSVSGDVVVRLGAPSDASVTLDGRPVQFPTGYRAPLDLTFQTAR